MSEINNRAFKKGKKKEKLSVIMWGEEDRSTE